LEAIEYIGQLQKEAKAASFSKVIPNDPFNTQGIMQQELDVGFNILYGIENQVLQKIEGKR
jgi:hypothetical protein